MDKSAIRAVGERLARGEFPVTPPTQDELPRFESHDDLEIAKSLEMLAEQLESTTSDPYAWKWVIIALHNCVQAVIVRAISGGDGAGALSDKSQKATRAWLTGLRDGEPHEERPDQYLADFMELYRRAKRRRPSAIVHPRLDEDMRHLNEYRRRFAHYAPMIWAILVGGMPSVVLRCLDFVESLMPGRPTGGLQWLVESEGELAERSLALARERARALESKFGQARS